MDTKMYTASHFDLAQDLGLTLTHEPGPQAAVLSQIHDIFNIPKP